MIWTFKIECDWGLYIEEDWIRTVELDSRTTLYGLHLYIQKIVEFDNDHLFEFFAGRHNRNRKIEFVSDLWDFEYENVPDEYEELTLEEIYPLPKGLKLFYHFDFGDDWYFKITQTRKKPTEPQEGIQYPRVIEKVGPNPVQYPEYGEDE
jgi:hypothetical protein